MNAERWTFALILAVVLAVAGSVGRSSGGDVVVSGKVRHDALLQVGVDPPGPYEVSTLRYIVEAPPSTVGVVVPLEVEIMESLCRDKDGCQVALQMVNALPEDEPGQVESESTWLFLSELSRFFRYAGRFLENSNSISGMDHFGPGYLTTADWRVSDCILTPAESVLGGPNDRSDDAVGFGLLNCANTGLPAEPGGFDCLAPDDTTTCRVVMVD